MNILLIGKPGTGKTTVACQMPEPIFLIDIDAKAKGQVNLMPRIESGAIEVYSMKSRLVESRLSERALNPHKGIKNEPKGYIEIVDLLNDIMEGKEYQGYATYVLDSLSRFEEHLKRLLIWHRTKKRLGEFKEDKVDDMNWPAWGSYLANLEELMDACTKYIPGHFVCTVHEKHLITMDPLTNTEIDQGKWPLISGQMREKLSGYFNETYHLQGKYTKTTGSSWKLLTAGRDICARTSMTLDAEEEADMKKIFKKAGLSYLYDKSS